jgi:endonuclease YncB( thermonuclease family)
MPTNRIDRYWLRAIATRLLAALALLAAAPTLAGALTITGAPEVTKPYSFNLQEYRVFQLGVDSVEIGQSCTIGGQRWECWAAAQRELETIVSEGEVTCDTVTEPDGVGRVIAVCTVNGEDIGERFVRSGFGLAISDETAQYDDAQAEARAAGIGLWQADFDPPDVWRALPMRPNSNRPPFTPAAD